MVKNYFLRERLGVTFDTMQIFMVMEHKEFCILCAKSQTNICKWLPPIVLHHLLGYVEPLKLWFYQLIFIVKEIFWALNLFILCCYIWQWSRWRNSFAAYSNNHGICKDIGLSLTYNHWRFSCSKIWTRRWCLSCVCFLDLP